MMPLSTGKFDFNRRPFLTIWETTHACDLACSHCRAEAEKHPKPDELTTEEAQHLIDQVAAMGTPIFIFSGGDPLKRSDLPQLIRHAKSKSLKTGAIPAVSPELTSQAIELLREAGLDQIAFSLDSPHEEIHDRFRQTPGVFQRTLKAVQSAKECGLAVQINSLINLHNLEDLDRLIELMEGLNIVFWEIFFLVPVGRGKELSVLEAFKFEEAFAKIYQLSQRAPFIIKVTEAPHFRRFCFEQDLIRRGGNPSEVTFSQVKFIDHFKNTALRHGKIGLAPQGVNAGKGFLFISCQGEVMPNGFLPLSAGNIRQHSLQALYSDHPMMKELRDPALLKGRCGICVYRDLCGGSRSRAYALTGDYLAEDPCCAYQPVLEEPKG